MAYTRPKAITIGLLSVCARQTLCGKLMNSQAYKLTNS